MPLFMHPSVVGTGKMNLISGLGASKKFREVEFVFKSLAFSMIAHFKI